jgi:hypothetical protein
LYRYGSVAEGANDGLGEGQAKVYSWAEFMTLGKDVPDATVAARIADQKPGRVGTFHHVMLQSKHRLMTASIVAQYD